MAYIAPAFYRCATQPTYNEVLESHLLWDQKVKDRRYESQKQCRRGSLHSCECWLLLVRVDACSADDVYKLWRIFNALAETVDDVESSEAAVPVAVHADELALIVQRLGVILRTAVHVDAASHASNFAEFLRAIETSCLAGKNASVVSSAVGELYDDIIADVLKKVSSAKWTVGSTLFQTFSL